MLISQVNAVYFFIYDNSVVFHFIRFDDNLYINVTLTLFPFIIFKVMMEHWEISAVGLYQFIGFLLGELVIFLGE